MSQVILSEVGLNGPDSWETIDAGQVSLLPGSAEGEEDILIAVRFNIASPLSNLKRILQQKLCLDLSDCQLWLQGILQVLKKCFSIFPHETFLLNLLFAAQ